MKKIILVSIFTALSTLAVSSVYAQFSLPGLGASKQPAENPGDVVKNSRNALLSYENSKVSLLEAMGASQQVAAQKQTLSGIQSGDAGNSKDDLETIVKTDASTTELLNKKMAENTKMDAQGKQSASKAMVQYVGGLVSSKKLIGSIQSLAKNPVALGANMNTIAYLGKELPGVVSSGVTTSSALFKYLGSNGVDLTEAKKASDDLGK